MKYSDLLSKVSVLFLEENDVQRDLFSRWITTVSTKTVTEPEEVFREFDSSVALVILSHSALEDEEAEIQRYILTRNPSCQVVLLTSPEADEARYRAEYDATITRPVSERELTTLVEKRLRYGIYSALIEEFYALNSRLITLERSDSDRDSERTETIRDRIRKVEVPIQHLRSTIDHEDTRELLKSLNSHREFLNSPSRETEASTTSTSPSGPVSESLTYLGRRSR
ncbi:hypothetical protein [Halorubrum cibi]|uniref:HalX domain-containing protein n=1 Tax=Halorubrum cibi TaxID=413815 RepID=A0A521ALQ4_9EURY|nr:hypothetical protein [Halorubrum cibi]SMO35735.1 hypothetical protein SAMN06264867_101241 [Halorubrum cibi]